MTKLLHEAQVDIRVSLDGVPYGASWDTASGGQLQGNNLKYKPGSMGDEISMGGPASRSDLTVSIQMSDIVATWIPAFENRAGLGSIKVAESYLDNEHLPISTLTRTGTLKDVTVPDMDGSNNSPGRAIFTIVVDCNERAA